MKQKKIDALFIDLLTDLELAEQYYPEFAERVRDKLRDMDPIIRAGIFKKIPEHFPNWKAEADQHLGIKRRKLINSYIDIISKALYFCLNDEEIRNTIEPIKDELEEQLEYWEKELSKPQQKPLLTINQIALFHVYENKPVNSENCNDIINSYGLNSGQKLFDRYNYYSKPCNRKGEPTGCTRKKLDNKIHLINSVIEILSKPNKDRAIAEVKILETIRRKYE